MFLANKYVYDRTLVSGSLRSPIATIGRFMESLANHFSLVSSSMSQDAQTKRNALLANAARRRYRRTVDLTFVKKERASNQRYRENNRWALEFARTYPQQFDQFRREMIAQAMRQQQ